MRSRGDIIFPLLDAEEDGYDLEPPPPPPPPPPVDFCVDEDCGRAVLRSRRGRKTMNISDLYLIVYKREREYLRTEEEVREAGEEGLLVDFL